MNYTNMNDELRIQEPSSLVDKAETDLLDFFQEQQYKTGDVIPKEVELAVQLGVSRTVVREAMQRLRMRGMVDTKKKRGTVITNPDLLLLLEKTMYPGILDDETLRDIFELRMVLEIGMGDLLFERITQRDIDELYTIVADEPVNTEEVIFDAEKEIRFHGKLYEITGNRTLKRFQRMLLPTFEYVHNSGILKKPVQHKKFVSHRGLVDVLQHGTPETFRNAMRNHFENNFQRIF
ncbi:GntR family transcriptional regulator [Rhabdobacter roseus]|uniref:DNA-binding FadR family transcriptional regulator n=1 Tax=Rhabdobacter roseus TaxID=1655419 RepID=A0A840TSZ1_9BACT|nr:FCD domain-containing protein [Rhabdobacter roseus]MBB5283120.1 DNA-binding FadR family transcriptional regulator [Rhabdobacter roseus]